MSDEEDYNSGEDADYVPSDGELGSEEENSGDEEDLSLLADDTNTAASTRAKKTPKKRTQKKNDLAPSKRRGGIRLEDGQRKDAEGASGNTNGDAENQELAQKIKEEEAQKKAEKEKKRAEDLWSSFLTDVEPKRKPGPTQSVSSSSCGSSTAGSVKTLSSSPPSSSSSAAAPNQSNGSTSGKITITQVYDFAGEEIKVTKEVSADSKEAKEELKKQEQIEQQKATTTATASSSSSSSSLLSIAANSRGLPIAGSASAGAGVLGVKRPAAGAGGGAGGGGLGSILSKIGKKQKMGTLEKSKMDWDSFKKKEGIEEDLKIHNKGKDGYLERMSFMSRTDIRQFEIERELRLSKSGKR